MRNTENRNKISTTTKRFGWYSALAAVMLLVLAACGTASTTGPDTGTGAGQPATATTEPTLTVPTTGPAATPTTGDDADDSDDASDDVNDGDDAAGDMDEMDGVDDGATAVPTNPAAPAAVTATPAAGTSNPVAVSAEVQATLREWAIDLSVQEVAAGKITIVVNNQGQFAHNLAVTDGSGTLVKTPTFRGSEGPQTLEVELQPGTYTLICDLPGHAAMGQSIELVVR